MDFFTNESFDDVLDDVVIESIECLSGKRIECLSEVFLHYKVVVCDGNVLFSTFHEDKGSGMVHFTIGREKESIPRIVRHLVASKLNEHSKIVVSCPSNYLTSFEVPSDTHFRLHVHTQRVYQHYLVTPNSLVLRRILEEGTGRDSPELGAKVTLNCSWYGEQKDKTLHLVKKDENINFSIGINESVEGLEEAVMKMKLKEQALIQMDSSYCMGSRFQIADSFSTIYVKVHLLAFENSAHEWEMSSEEKLNYALYRKKRGNEYFQKGIYERASESYEKALELIQFESTDALKLNCFNNLALCAIKQKDFYKALQYATDALDVSPSDVTALTRRACARVHCGLPEDALDDVKRINALDAPPSILKIVASVASKAKDLQLQSKKKEKRMFGGVFAT